MAEEGERMGGIIEDRERQINGGEGVKGKNEGQISEGGRRER